MFCCSFGAYRATPVKWSVFGEFLGIAILSWMRKTYDLSLEPSSTTLQGVVCLIFAPRLSKKTFPIYKNNYISGGISEIPWWFQSRRVYNSLC